MILSIFFFFNDTATTEIYTLPLHDALPIYIIPPAAITDTRAITSQGTTPQRPTVRRALPAKHRQMDEGAKSQRMRSEEHTSELQSRLHLVCRLLLAKKN